MAYKKTNWQPTLKDAQGNVQQQGTPLTASYLNNIENGIAQAAEKEEVQEVVRKLADTGGNLESRGLSLYGFSRLAPEVDDTGRITRGIKAANGKSLFIPPAEYSIGNAIPLVANVHIIGYGAKITQKATNTPIFVVGNVSNIFISGISFVGVGTDYTKLTGSLARAIDIFGSGVEKNKKITIIDCSFLNFSYAAIALRFVDNFYISRNLIVGTGDLGNISKGDNYQFGIWLGESCYNGVVAHNEVSKTAQGIYTGYDMYNIYFGVNNIHDIPGQHGFYISHADTVWIIDNTVKKCNLIGIKLQQAASSTAISKSVKIMSNDVSECGEHGIVTDNTDTTKRLQMYDVLIGFNNVRDCAAEGYSINDLVNSKLIGNKVSNSESFIVDTTKSRHGMAINDCENVEIFDTNIRNTNGIGFYINFRNKNIRIKKASIFEAGQAGLANTNYGAYVQEGSDILFDEIEVSDATGKSLYSFANVNSTNLKVKNSKFNDKDVRFFTVQPVEWNNNEVKTNIINYPSTVMKGTKAVIYHGPIASAPTTIAGYKNGDRYEYTNPTAGGFIGKILVGGVWKDYGAISV